MRLCINCFHGPLNSLYVSYLSCFLEYTQNIESLHYKKASTCICARDHRIPLKTFFSWSQFFEFKPLGLCRAFVEVSSVFTFSYILFCNKGTAFIHLNCMGRNQNSFLRLFTSALCFCNIFMISKPISSYLAWKTTQEQEAITMSQEDQVWKWAW